MTEIVAEDEMARVEPEVVKRVELYYKDGPVRVMYATSVGNYEDRVELYGPLWPRRGWSWRVSLADVVEMFIDNLPAADVPELPESEAADVCADGVLLPGPGSVSS